MYAWGLENMIFELREYEKNMKLSRYRYLEIVFLAHKIFK